MPESRQCLCCNQFFEPNPRSANRQQFCSKPGYRVYRGEATRLYDNVVDVGNITACTNDFPLGKHFVAVTAYDTDGLESDFSEELAIEIVTPPLLRFESNTLTWAGEGMWQVG